MWFGRIFYILFNFFIGNKLFIKDELIIGNKGKDMRKNISVAELETEMFFLQKIKGHLNNRKVLELLENKNISDAVKLELIKEVPLLDDLNRESIKASEWYLGLDW